MIVLMNRYNFKEFLPYYASLDFTFTPNDSSVSDPYFFLSNPSTDDFTLELYTSGTLTFNMSFYADWFAVGGGGSGGATSGFTGGGGGGYTATVLNNPIIKNNSYVIYVGAGGTAGVNSNGGVSSVSSTNTGLIISANGGLYGKVRAGGAGGSGGGGGSYGNRKTGGAGGSNGSNGAAGAGGNSAGAGGKGQGTTTRAFGESTGKLYAGGGGGGSAGNSDYPNQAAGGDGGGGIGGGRNSINPGGNGTPNTGGGGGGCNANGASGAGGSGIIIVRFSKTFASYLNG